MDLRKLFSIFARPTDERTVVPEVVHVENSYQDAAVAFGYEFFEGEPLRALLDKVVSPRVEPLGLKWRGDYYWLGESRDGIRPVLHYLLLRARGVFHWGVALDCVKMPSGNKLVYQRTEKTAKLHLFERPDAYVSGFYGGSLDAGEGMGVVSHWRSTAEPALISSLEYLNDEMTAWFDEARTLAGVTEIAERQVRQIGQPGNIYRNHHPAPEYILAHLYAKSGRLEEALGVLDGLGDRLEADFYDRVREHLVGLSR